MPHARFPVRARGSITRSPYQPVFEIISPTEPARLSSTPPPRWDIRAQTVPTVYFADDVILTGARILTVNGPVVLVVLEIQNSGQTLRSS